MNHSNYCARALAAWAILLPMLAHAVPPTLGRCQVLPSDHVLNARIDDLPVHPQSADFIRTISSGSRRLHLDLGISEDTQASDYYGGESPVRSLVITVLTNPADSDNDGIADTY